MKRKYLLAFAVAVFLVSALHGPVAADVNIAQRWLETTWDAQWCAHPDGPGHDPSAFLFRRSFDLSAKPDRFVIHTSADQRYQLFVNGVRVATGPARGDLLHWHFETLDIAPWLKPGKNVLAALVWSSGILAPWAQLTAHTAFLAQGDGAPERIINTPGDWKVFRDLGWETFPKPGTLPSFSVAGANERITAARHPWGWMETDFDDASWQKPAVVSPAVPSGMRGDGSAPWYLVPRSIPLMEEKPARIPIIVRAKRATVPPAFLEGNHPFEIPPRTKATILLDNRVLTNGYPELVTSGGAGARIRLSYEESLFRSPEVLMGRLIKGNRDDVKKCAIRDDYRFDEFLPDGGRARRFSPLWWRTFRFLQLDIQTAGAPLVLDDLRVIETGYPFDARATFDSSDPSLRTVWDTGWRTARLCAGETYFDCPYYEQLQYAGDTRIQAIISYYVAGDDRLARNAIELLADSRTPEGLTQSRYPNRMHQIIPPFSLAWIGMIHDHRQFRRDDAFDRRFLPGIREVLDWFGNRRLKNGLLGGLPWWNFVDWSWPGGVPPGAGAEGSSVLSLQYILALRQAADLESALGAPEVAKQHRSRADAMARQVKKTCWSAKRGLYADTPAQTSFSQHASTLAVLAGLVPPAQQKAVMERTLSDPALTQATFQFRSQLHKAVEKAGLGDRYLSLLAPWRQMLDLGLTTWPETDGESRSDCHAWSASPTYELLSIVAGIQPAAPGFARVRIEPHPGTLNWVKAQVPHPNGMIRVYLRKENNHIAADIELPPGTPGVFVLSGKATALHPGRQILRQ